MSDDKSNATANLEFFKAAILHPALRHQRFWDDREAGSTVADFGAIEAAHWAWIGVVSGYFDGKAAYDLISSSKGVFNAWSNLRDRGVISAEDDLAAIITQKAEGGQLVLAKEFFFEIEESAPDPRELLYQTFQTFLLLATENIFKWDSIYFLDSIGWADHEWWNVHRRGAIHPSIIGTVQDIGSGFANILNYWEEMSQPSLTSPEVPTARILNVPVQRLNETVRFLMQPRFNLGQTEIVDRYFVLAGEFANRAKEDSPAWLDARLNLFKKLILLITYAGGETSVRKDNTRLWNLFASSIESSPTAVWRKLRVKPPEEFA